MSDTDFDHGVIYALEYLETLYPDVQFTNLWNDHQCTKCLELRAGLVDETCGACRNA
jgi:hypothetical protein